MSPGDSGGEHQLTATGEDAGSRLDLFVSGRLREQSRAAVARWIRDGEVTVNGKPARPSHRLEAGDLVLVHEPEAAPTTLVPEAIPLDVLFEDDHLAVLVKPAGLVVHPGAGVTSGTLVHALLARVPEWSTIGGAIRPGIVHRLDRDTSGVMIVARNDVAHRGLAVQFRDRLIRKEYVAVVFGHPDPPAGRIEGPIGRHRVQRSRMAVRDSGREAATRYRTEETPGRCARLTLWPLTGRTHQIRVHLSEMGHPIVGDPVYGGEQRARDLPAGSERDTLEAFPRTALHAAGIAFAHPMTGEEMEFAAPLPPDLEGLLQRLRGHAA